MDNNYLSIANNDYLYAKAIKDLGFNNNVGFTCVNTVEKLFKSVAELTVQDCSELLRSHNLRRLYRSISHEISLDIHEGDLSTMTDFYFDSRYPGDDFTEITDDDLKMCYEILEKVYTAVNNWHNSNNKKKSLLDTTRIANPNLRR